jgi:hypothetical protein
MGSYFVIHPSLKLLASSAPPRQPPEYLGL